MVDEEEPIVDADEPVNKKRKTAVEDELCNNVIQKQIGLSKFLHELHCNNIYLLNNSNVYIYIFT